MSVLRPRWQARMLWMGAILLVLILGASMLLKRTGTEALQAPASQSPERPLEQLDPASREPLDAAAWDPSGPPVDESEVAAPASSSEATAAGFEVVVLLTERASGLPLAAHSVHLRDTETSAKGLTDAGGRARLVLAGTTRRSGRTAGIEVQNPERARVFWGSVPLAPEIHLALPSRVRLHGTLSCEPPLAYRDLGLTVTLPPRQAITVALWYGSTQLGEDGSFELHVFEPVPTEEYLLKFTRSDVLLAEILVPRAELVSAEGALVQSRSCELLLHFTTSEGEPIEGVELRLCPLVGETIFSLQTDERGDARTFVREGGYQLCAGKEGFRTLAERIEIDGSSSLLTRNVVLERLADSDRVRGTVRSSTGEPVAGALVTLMPSTAKGDAAVAAAVQQETDVAGAFVLPVELGTSFDLAAYHREHGLTELVGLLANGSEPEIRFADRTALGSLVVELLDLPETEAPAGGPWQWVLVPRDGGPSAAGYEFVSPWTWEELAAGEYELFVRAPGAVAFGRQSVRVLAGETVRTGVGLVPMRWARGTLAFPPARAEHAWELELRPPGWTAETCRYLGRAPIRTDGGFEIPVGDSRRVPAVLLEDGVEIATVELAADESNTLVVAERH